MLQLEIKNIAVNYGKKEVIKDVSCVFNGGDVISLIGPNGTGKTTILKAIAKLISHHGEIKIIQDSEVKTFRESITYVPQMSVNIVNLTVFEMVLLGRVKDLTWKVEKVHLDAVAQILEELHLTPLSYTKFSSLSGGQKQMVIMAQALVSAPKVLLLDAEAVFFGLLPQAAADAGLQASGATGPLPGPGQRDAHGLQTRKTAGRIETALAGKSRVHHQTDAFDQRQSR